MTGVMGVTRGRGKVILALSGRTSYKNLKGLTFAIVPCPIVPIEDPLPPQTAAPELLARPEETAHPTPAPILERMRPRAGPFVGYHRRGSPKTRPADDTVT